MGTIPESCKGLILQTPYLPQDGFFNYVTQSKFLFVPQVHDASPRVTTQALALNRPLLMNRNLIGGWKYINENTGEFFNDLSDFRQSLEKILRDIDKYKPKEWVMQNYGDMHSGRRLKAWIVENFGDRVYMPPGTTMLEPSGA